MTWHHLAFTEGPKSKILIRERKINDRGTQREHHIKIEAERLA